MSKFRLSRRTMLKGATGVAALKLCTLEAMLDSRGNAWGQTAAAKRFVLFYQGNGVCARGYSGMACKWVPLSTGANPALNTAMAGLMDPLRQYMRVMTGLSHGWSDTGSGEPHAEGMSWSLTGKRAPTPGVTVGGPTPDYILAPYLQGRAPIRLLQVGVWRGDGYGTARKKISADTNGTLIDPEYSPQVVFNRLFGNFTAPGGAQLSVTQPDAGSPQAAVTLTPEQQRQQRIVDFVKRDADRLRKKLGVADQQRLDAHLAAVHDLEAELFPSDPGAGGGGAMTGSGGGMSGAGGGGMSGAGGGSMSGAGGGGMSGAGGGGAGGGMTGTGGGAGGGGGTTTTSCARPADPGASSSTASQDVRCKLMCDLIAMAFACDQVRTVSFMGSSANNQELLGWLSTSGGQKLPAKRFHEDISHLQSGSPTWADWFTNMVAITQWHVKYYAYLFGRLKGMLDIGGNSVLDNTLGVFTSEFGNSQNHANFDVPYLLVGGSQFIGGNYHWRSAGANVQGVGGDVNTKLWNSVIQAMGAPLTSFAGQSGTVPLK